MLVFHRLFSLEQFRFPSNVEGKFVEMRYRFSDVILRAMVSASVPASSHPAEAELVGVCTGCLSPLPPLLSYWTLDGDLLQFARAHTHTHTHEHTRKENLASQRVSLMPLINQSQRLCGLSPSPHTAARPHGSHIPRLPVLLPPPGHHLPSFRLFKPCLLLRVQPGDFASTVRPSWGPSALF